MSVADNWKLDGFLTEDKNNAWTEIDYRVRKALCEFEAKYNIHPNRIIMGYRLANELRGVLDERRTYRSILPMCDLLEFLYAGIPVELDYANPEKLSVGYMVE